MRRLLAVLVLLPLAAAAGDDAKKKRDFTKLSKIEGTVVCIGCELEKDGADAQCTLNAKHAQGVKDADGRIWSLVDNARGHGVITGEKLRGQQIRVRGWVFEKARFVEVWQYELKDGDAWVVWSYCGNCGWEKGDLGEAELCEDCKE